ncbi:MULTISPECIES: YbjP/YqhG family protein [Enterobacter]|uniref:YbjP/YqhG family protein n=1 Tax=Enterobacter TaxID=547 RepID=UPI000FEB94C4|nr:MULTISPECIES: YbjP/YqhG family protein [Enterobacter]MCR1302103.1 YbjP/YqhG family protein [Enterobacter sp. FL1277]MCR1307136.1 YbjP/YqhG family protein [Enterobacter sp. BT1271]MCR1312878.1 YbjP/YqhG family protein [Enterobacter sp. BT855]MCR1323384.1 YbjP/YqhG family protein [Enterobacter sp. BT1268]MCR1329321.1 YbjP/YqhG family protein [Enterobacter sp. BT1131]
MKRIFILFGMLLVGCSSTANHDQSAQDTTKSFYKSYLSAFGSDVAMPYPADELRKYVSADTIVRIGAIQEISEQELIESDYFTYTQDYSREWIPALRVENARPFLNGEVVQVIEGAGGGRSIHLEVFLRREGDAWKIYRVRDITNNHEHPIFNTGAITRAKAAAESAL